MLHRDKFYIQFHAVNTKRELTKSYSDTKSSISWFSDFQQQK